MRQDLDRTGREGVASCAEGVAASTDRCDGRLLQDVPLDKRRIVHGEIVGRAEERGGQTLCGLGALRRGVLLLELLLLLLKVLVLVLVLVQAGHLQGSGEPGITFAKSLAVPHLSSKTPESCLARAAQGRRQLVRFQVGQGACLCGELLREEGGRWHDGAPWKKRRGAPRLRVGTRLGQPQYRV